MKTLKSLVNLSGGLLLCAASLAHAQAPAAPTPKRELKQIVDNVYRFRNNNYNSLVVSTPAGVIVTNPDNAEAATWLKAEIKKQFNQPVRYLVYTHDHSDHISGGEVFKDTAVVVSHEYARKVLVREKRNAALPDLTFNEKLSIELGGTQVELSYVGRNVSNGTLVVRVPKSRVLYSADTAYVNVLPYMDFPDTSNIEDWIESLQRMETMEFDTFVPGHGPVNGNKSNVTAFREYLSDLHAQVFDYVLAGKTVEQAQETIKLPKYEKWYGYKDMLPFNVQGMYKLIELNRYQ